MTGDNFLQGFTAVGLLGLLGAALRWSWQQLTGRMDKRQQDIDAREKLLDGMVDSRLKQMEETISALSTRVTVLGDLVGNQRTAIILLLAEVQRAAPNSPVLHQVSRLLGDEFPFILQPLPADIKDLTDRISERSKE